LVGLLAGLLAKLSMLGDDPGGIIVTILIGIAGDFVGGFVFSRFGGTPARRSCRLPVAAALEERVVAIGAVAGTYSES